MLLMLLHITTVHQTTVQSHNRAHGVELNLTLCVWLQFCLNKLHLSVKKCTAENSNSEPICACVKLAEAFSKAESSTVYSYDPYLVRVAVFKISPSRTAI